MKNDNENERIAIIGMAGRFPGAKNTEQFWENLRNSKNCLSNFSDEELKNRGVIDEELSNPNYVKAGFVLEDIELFDEGFFGYNAREAEMMDPQQRIFLETSWEALENAGCNPESYKGSIGVFGGINSSDYVKRIPASWQSVTSGIDSFQAMLGNDPDFLATRVSYKLNLKGPSFTLQTACSTSLVAVHVACLNLLTHQCDIALTGGVAVRLPQGVGYTYHEGMLWSPDGYCRAFDENAQGTVFGRGVGVVVLKRLSEAVKEKDFIYAVIRGSAINNDGAVKVGYTAPSVDGQAEVISRALESSQTDPGTIDYVEAHGTGTKLGDPIEIEALKKAFRTKTDKTGFCGIGSVKTNIGHLDVAAGIASLIKTTLALHHRELPPSLNFSNPNPNIDFINSPFYVVHSLKPWESKGKPRRAGVSSFGIGGTNAHVILEEFPEYVPTYSDGTPQLLPLSAKTPAALTGRSEALAAYLQSHPDCSLADVAYTLQTGRKNFQYRKAIVCREISQAVQTLTEERIDAVSPTVAAFREKKMVFMFSGQGSQYINMCRGLYEEEPFFKSQVDICAQGLAPLLGLDLRKILYPVDGEVQEKELINQTWITQPALFVIEYSLARLLMSWGLVPDVMVGHSIGEYTAACLSGVFSLSDTLMLVATRGRMMQDLETGSMLSVPLSEEEIIEILPQDLSVAVINSPQLTVVSGKTENIEDFRNSLTATRGIEARIVPTSHAFHSFMMDPILENFSSLVNSFKRSAPLIPFVSNTSGKWITPEEAVSGEYWSRHLRQTVRFNTCIATLRDEGYRKFVEIGPGQVLASLTRHNISDADSLVFSTTRRQMETIEDVDRLLKTVGQLWTAGVEIDFTRIFSESKMNKIPLPAYPFQRKRFWIPAGEKVFEPRKFIAPEKNMISETDILRNQASPRVVTSRNDLELQLSNIFCNILGLSRIDVHTGFFDAGGDSVLASQLLAETNKVMNGTLSLVDIFENSSIEALANKIQQGGGRLRSPVIALNNATSGQLVYFVVGIHLYHELALQLSDIACCYGTFLPVEEVLLVSGVEYKKWKVSDLAAAYREEILKHSQGNPVSIIGVSFGGVVAYELARQLTENGVNVSLLVMLDSLLPSGMHRNFFKWFGAQLKKVTKYGIGHVTGKMKSRLESKKQKRQRLSMQQFSADEKIPDQRLVVYADAVERFERTEAQSKYGGRTLLIHAKDAPRFPGYSIKPHFGWKKHLTGEFCIDTAPGDHLGLLKPPNVEVTADIIRNVLVGKKNCS